MLEQTLQIENLPFLNYVFNNIVGKQHRSTSDFLRIIKSSYPSELSFYWMFLNIDAISIQRKLGVGVVESKKVARLFEMFKQIIERPGSLLCFNSPDRAQLFTPVLEKRLSREHIRIYHAYQQYMEDCKGSILNFYLSIAGSLSSDIKFSGLNKEKSLGLLNLFLTTLDEIDAFLVASDSPDSVEYKSVKHNLPFSEEFLLSAEELSEKIGHFPLFSAINELYQKLEDRDKVISISLLNFFYNKSIKDLTEVAESLGITRERARQLKIKLLNKVIALPAPLVGANLLGDYHYSAQSEADFRHIREEESVDFSNDYIIVCLSVLEPSLALIGDIENALTKPYNTSNRLYLVPQEIAEIFDFSKFISVIEEMKSEKRYAPYRNDLDSFVRGLLTNEVTDDYFYSIVKECRLILSRTYPDNIVNSQVVFVANARKNIPYLIEDILREFNRPMHSEELCSVFNERYPDIEQDQIKIGANALRNKNIVAISRTSTYTLAEWSSGEKRGGTIRELAEEYLNTLALPIAPLSDICEYVSQFRNNVKEDSVKANLLLESSNRYSAYYKDDIVYIGLTDYQFGEEYSRQDKRHPGRRSFDESINLLEKFIKENNRFPYGSNVEDDEKRLNRFYYTTKAQLNKGLLSVEEISQIERIDQLYGHLKLKKERISWEEYFERFVKYITDNDALPRLSSKERKWFEDNKAIYEAGGLQSDRAGSFSYLVKIIKHIDL